MGSFPTRLPLLLLLHVAVILLFCGGTGGRGGEPCPTKLPRPIPENMGSWRDLTPHFHVHFIHAVPLPSGTAGQDPYPTCSLHFVSRVCPSYCRAHLWNQNAHSYSMHVGLCWLVLPRVQNICACLVGVCVSEGGQLCTPNASSCLLDGFHRKLKMSACVFLCE